MPKQRKKPSRHAKALKHLRGADPVLAAIIKQVGECKLSRTSTGTHFDHVVRAIIFQQLSGKAAGTIHKRVEALFKNNPPTAAQILKTPDETLRSAGLSRQKISYLKDLSEKVVSGEVAIDTLHEHDADEPIIEALVKVKGVGRWTAQMFLLFRLGRKDVMPVVDLGINKAIMIAYGLKKMPKPDEVLKIATKWAPYRSIACWYLWRSLD